MAAPALQAPNSTAAYAPLPTNAFGTVAGASPITFGVPALPSQSTKTVVTAKPATIDLAAKQANVDAASTAMATQQYGQPIGPQQPQPQQMGAQHQQGMPQDQTQGQPTGQQGPTTPPLKPPPPANTTTGQLLAMINSGQVNLTKEQVSQVAGLDFTGFQQNPDGTYSPDASAVQRVGQQNGQNGTKAPSTGDPQQDYISGQRVSLDEQAQKNYDEYTGQLQQIANGTFPLTQAQQGQLSALQAQFETLKQQQLTANKNYEGAVTNLGIRAGRSRYAPEIEQGNIQSAINLGLSKIADIDSKASIAIANLQQGFADNDYKLINAQYGALQDLMKHKDDSLKEMQQSIKDQMDMQTQKLTQQKTLMDIETSTIKNVAKGVMDDALQADGSLDFGLIQQAADDYGVDTNQLYSAILAQKDDYDAMQRDEQKFATDQETAKLSQKKTQIDIDRAPLEDAQTRAQIKATEASTANSYANLAKTKAETQKLQQDMQGLPGADGVTPFTNQPGYSKLTAKQKTQADSLNNLVRSLTKYKTDLDAKVGDRLGLNFFGADAAALESQLNSIIFAAAQAEGTGALQQADREVIEKIIPNPTSFSGAFSTATKGGKTGELAKLDEIISKYTSNLKTYGLSPVGENVVANPNGGDDIEITN